MVRSVSRTIHPWSPTWRMVKVPDWRLRWCGHPWHHVLSWDVIIHICVKFQFSSMITSVSRTPILEVILGGRWMFLTGVLEDRIILDIIYHYDMWFSTCFQNFSSLAFSEVCLEAQVLEVILGGCWWFLIGVFKDVVIFDIIDYLDRP